MIASGAIDALLIATPHYQHTSLGIAALEAGLHIMVEKPISAHKADAERLIAKANAHPIRFSPACSSSASSPLQKDSRDRAER